MAAAEVPLSANDLFGDDLEGSIKSVENTNKIAKKMEAPKKKPNNNNNNKNSYKGKKKRKFHNNNNNSGNNSSHDKKKERDKKDFQKRGSRN